MTRYSDFPLIIAKLRDCPFPGTSSKVYSYGTCEIKCCYKCFHLKVYLLIFDLPKGPLVILTKKEDPPPKVWRLNEGG